MIVDVADGDVDPYVGGLLPVVRPHQQRILGAPLAVQTPGGRQLAGLGIDAEAVVCAADDGVRHQSVRTLDTNRLRLYYLSSFDIIDSYCQKLEQKLTFLENKI